MYKSKNYLMCTYTVHAYFGILNNSVGAHRLSRSLDRWQTFTSLPRNSLSQMDMNPTDRSTEIQVCLNKHAFILVIL